MGAMTGKEEQIRKEIEELRARVKDLEKENREVRNSAQELFDESHYYRTILQSIGDAVIITDTKGRITGMNKMAEELTGWKLTQARKQPVEKVLRLINSLTAEKAENPVRIALQKKDIVELANHTRLISLDSREIPITDSAAPIMDEQGAILGVVMVFRDISESYKLRRALETSEKEYRYLFENNPHPMWVYDLETLAFLEVNNTAVQRYGFVREEFLQMTLRDLRPDNKFERLVEMIRADEQNFRSSGPWKHRTKSGEVFFVEISSHNILFNEKKARLVMAIDVTERIRIQQELERSEQKFRNVFHQHPAVKLLVDPESGNIVDANQAAAEFYGWSVGELRKMHISTLNINPVDIIREDIRKVKDRKSNYFEFRHRKADGSVADVEVYSGRVDFGDKMVLHSIVHDVSAKKKAEFFLRLFQHSVEQNPLGIIISGIDGTIVYVNPSFERLTGYSKAEVEGQSINIFNRNLEITRQGDELESKTYFIKIWDQLLYAGNRGLEFFSQRKNNEAFWQRIILSPIIDESGKTTHMVLVLEDISERKEITDQLIAAKNKAEESDRLKSAFLANMSHEIRTPMNGILGFAQLLGDARLNMEKMHEYISIIQKSGERMLNTVNDLIDISRIETGQMHLTLALTDINERIQNIFRFFEPQAAARGLRLILTNELQREFSLMTDHVKFDSVLTNLVRNAVKFTDKGEIEIGYRLRGNELLFFVRDTGMGIPPERQEAVFNRFEQSDLADSRAFQGSGLGLAIAKAYVDMLGGSLWLESEVDKGSTFWFTLPLRETALPGQEEAGEQSTQKAREGADQLKVIIAEDDESSSFYLSEILQEISREILLAGNGKEVVELCRENEDTDLILMDIRLPELDGYEASRQIRAFNTKVVIIAQTAYAMSGDRNKALEAGCNDYISKPVIREELLGKISRCTKPAPSETS
ncbi:MAG: PAS domain S-box protein [Bacteroidota bacterium]